MWQNFVKEQIQKSAPVRSDKILGETSRFVQISQRARVRKGQISVEYIAGFILFMFVVAFIASAVIQNAPRSYEDRIQNNINSEAWLFSERFLNATTKGDASAFLFDSQKIAQVGVCTAYNPREPSTIAAYENLRGNFSVPLTRDWHAVIALRPLVQTREPRTIGAVTNYTGAAVIEGTSADFEVSNFSLVYDTVRINGGPLLRAGDATLIGTGVYTISKVLENGQFVILSRNLVDCGKTVPLGTTVSTVRRFGNFGRDIATLDIEYW